jgi:TolB-like protein
MSAVLRARRVFPVGVVVLAAACAGGGGMRMSDVTPEQIPALESQRSAQPGNPGVLARLGVAYFKANRYADARTALDSAVARDPREAVAAIYLGMTTEQLGDFPAARAAYEQYLAVSRSSALRNTARQRLALIGRRELEYQARQALAQEGSLSEQAPEANTVAVMPFSYTGTNQQIQPLTRGLSQLVVTDLAKSRQIRVLERERMQAMVDEMQLSEENRADPRSAVRSGRLLRAARVVQGAIAERGDQLRVDAAVVDVGTAGVAAAAGTQDQLNRIFDLEKQLVLSIFNNLGIQLTDAERSAIDQRPTANIQAFLAWSQGLEAEDRGDFAQAQQLFAQAQQLDPNFQAAAQSGAQASDLSAAATQSTGDVEATVAQNEAQETGAAAPTDIQNTALQNGANSVAPTSTSQQLTEAQQVQTQPPAQRDNTPEGTHSEGTRTTGTVVIIIRRP